MKKKKKLLISTAIIAGVIGIGVYMLLPEPLIPDNRSGEFCPKCEKCGDEMRTFGVLVENE